MSLPPPRAVGDLTDLPTHAYGHRSLTWWGVIAFFMIEGAAFAMAFAAYFFLIPGEQSWPPEPFEPPDLLAGTLFTLIVLASEIPNTWVKKAAETKDLRTVRIGLAIMIAIAIPLFVLRGFEFASLNVWWHDNAYGSIMWALLLLHLAHFATDFVDTAVLACLVNTSHAAEDRRLVDVAENAMYWRFVWLLWLPIYLMVYWVPRWIP